MSALNSEDFQLFQATLKKVKLFEKISTHKIEQLARKSRFVAFDVGQTIFREGDLSRCMYIIFSGQVNVLTTGNDGNEILLASLGEKEFFGALSLLPSSPGRRSATLMTVKTCRLLEISAELFTQVVGDEKYLLDELTQLSTSSLSNRLIRQSALFNKLPLHLDNHQSMTQQRYKAGQVVFKYGDPGDKFYLIQSGIARIQRYQNGKVNQVNRLGAGSFFGEQALINNLPRNSTVIADEALHVLTLSGEKFLSLYATYPELREQLDQLGGFYQMSENVIVTLHAGKFNGMDSLTAIYHFSDKAQITATKVTRKPIFSMSRSDLAEKAKMIPFNTGNAYREILLYKHRIIGVTSFGLWPDLGRIHEMIIQSQRLFSWQVALFKVQGELWLRPEKEIFTDAAIVCRCMAVSRKVINESVEAGYNSVELIAKKTGAGKVCGSCIPIIERALGRMDKMQPVTLLKTIAITPVIKAFQFYSNDKETLPSLAGQHIRIEAMIDGRWIQRSYTLTSPAQQTQYYEITIKREKYGLFSSWMHDKYDKRSLVRVSKPQGNFYLQQKPICFFAGGIGITPAIAMSRSQKNPGQSIYIDYSVVKEEQIAYHDELKALTAKNNDIAINFRITHDKSFITQQDIYQLTATHQQAEYFICGPQTYEKAIKNYLKQCNVKTERIRIEHFNAYENHYRGKPKYQCAKSILFLSISILLASLFLLSSSFESEKFSFAWLWTDPDYKQISGFSLLLFALIGTGLFFSRNKILNFLNLPLWRKIHVFNGLFIISLICFHTGLDSGKNFNHLLWLNYWAIIISGALFGISVFYHQYFPQYKLSKINLILQWGHRLVLWPFPALIMIHILSVYYF